MKYLHRVGAVALAVLSLSSQVSASEFGANNGTILAGVLDLPRLNETGPEDGCSRVQTGLTIGGGFMLFTCEKLLPYLPITEQETAARRYYSALKEMGWQQQAAMEDGFKFTKYDDYGCKATLSVRVWKDRAMNETILSKRRDAYRQIVFTANYNGAACERYYPVVQAMKDTDRFTQLASR